MQISCHRFLKYWVSLLLIPSKSRTKGWKQVNTDVPGGGPVGNAEIRGHWGWSYSPKAPQEQHQEKHGFWNTEKPLLPETPLLPGTSLFPEMHPLPGEPDRTLPMPTLGQASAPVRTQRPCISHTETDLSCQERGSVWLRQRKIWQEKLLKRILFKKLEI